MSEKLQPVNFFSKKRQPTVVKYFDQEIKIIESEESKKTPFPTCIILMLPNLIGTHEKTKPEGLKTIDYSEGWKGKPIAVATLNEELIEKLGEGVHVIENVDYGEFGVLDGHHRREMAERGGLAYAVTQLFPLLHPNVIIDTWLENFTALTPTQVVQYFKKQEETVEPKATKFQIVGTDGNKRRIAEAQPDVKVPLKRLQEKL